MKKYLSVLSKSAFFNNMDDEEILSILHCVSAYISKARSGEYIFTAGDTTNVMGLVLKGSTLIIQEDLWGHRNIISRCKTGDFFGEPYAANEGSILNVSVVADDNCEVLMLNVGRLMTTCSTVCSHHQKLIQNLVNVLAKKIMIFNDKITHMSKRTTREKLLSYLSAESLRHGSLEFNIPYDRQQLADFLSVERAAMSAELSKLQKEGYLETNRSHFKLFMEDQHELGL